MKLGTTLKRTPRIYTDHLRSEAVEYYKNHSQRETSKKYDLPNGLIHSWFVKKYGHGKKVTSIEVPLITDEPKPAQQAPVVRIRKKEPVYKQIPVIEEKKSKIAVIVSDDAEQILNVLKGL